MVSRGIKIEMETKTEKKLKREPQTAEIINRVRKPELTNGVNYKRRFVEDDTLLNYKDLEDGK